MTRSGIAWLVTALTALSSGAAACDGDGAPSDIDSGAHADGAADAAAGDASAPPPAEDWGRDLLSTALEIDLANHTGVAVIAMAPGASGGASFEIGDLTIVGARDARGPLEHVVHDGQLDVGVPVTDEPVEITIEYGFAVHDEFDGYLDRGMTFLWPEFCHNLFPCKGDPVDGLRFTLAIEGVPDGEVAVFPASIPADAPSYMPAFAVGDYVHEPLGATTAGTAVGVYYLSGDQTAARAGTAHLVDYFDWLERTLGPYLYGDTVASVSADWGPGAFGGMEHHPLWHVARGAMSDRETHAHEAAHGWFGNGIRIRCWEDFVLSEGLASYLAARAIEEAEGAAAGDAVWSGYQSRLEAAIAGEDTVAWVTDGCNAIDILHHPLWSSVPYMKGAFFVRAVEQEVGRAALDAALAGFYAARAGTAAGMQDLIDAIAADTGIDRDRLDALVEDWLRSLGSPPENSPPP
jgi:hypothetical protein